MSAPGPDQLPDHVDVVRSEPLPSTIGLQQRRPVQLVDVIERHPGVDQDPYRLGVAVLAGRDQRRAAEAVGAPALLRRGGGRPAGSRCIPRRRRTGRPSPRARPSRRDRRRRPAAATATEVRFAFVATTSGVCSCWSFCASRSASAAIAARAAVRSPASAARNRDRVASVRDMRDFFVVGIGRRGGRAARQSRGAAGGCRTRRGGSGRRRRRSERQPRDGAAAGEQGGQCQPASNTADARDDAQARMAYQNGVRSARGIHLA